MSMDFSLNTDASAFQFCYALFQVGKDVVSYPISLRYRSLNAAEKNYSAGKRETLAIIFAVQLLHSYLWCKHWEVFTDHQALRWVFSIDEPKGRLSKRCWGTYTQRNARS